MIIEKQYINKQAHNSVLVQLKKAQARKPLYPILKDDLPLIRHVERK